MWMRVVARCLVIASLTSACASSEEGPHLRARERQERAPSRETAQARGAEPWGGLDVIERGDPSADLAFVLMHGYGAPGDDLVSLADELVRRVPRPLRVVVPAAPIAMSHGGRAWYEIDSAEAPAQTERACVAIEGVIETLAARGVSASRVIVGGFSQGGILSIETALRGHVRLAGIAVLSGRALPHAETDYGRLASLRIFQAHGRADARIAFAQGEAFGAAATRAGAVLEPVVFDGGHTIPPEVVVALARWIGELA